MSAVVIMDELQVLKIYRPSPSHWPLSQIRSSVRSRDDSSDLETFEMDWVGYHGHLVPYQERTIRNLTGRSLVCLRECSSSFA